MASVRLLGDQALAGRWLGWAQSKLRQLRASTKLRGVSVGFEKLIPAPGVTITLQVIMGLESIMIEAVSKVGGIFVSDYRGGQFSTGYKYAVRQYKVDSLEVDVWYDYGAVVAPRQFPGLYIDVMGVSYYQGYVYVVDNWGWMDIFKAEGSLVDSVDLFSKTPGTGYGYNASTVRVRAGKIYVAAGYEALTDQYEIHEFDLRTFAFIRTLPAAAPTLFGVESFAVYPGKDRLYTVGNASAGNPWQIYAYQISTGASLGAIGYLDGTQGTTSYGCDIYGGILYVSDKNNNRIVRVDVNNAVQLDPIPISTIFSGGNYLGGIAMLDDGFAAVVWGGTSPKIKKYKMDGTESKSIGDHIGVGYPDSTPANENALHSPRWIDTRNKENP